MPTQKPITNHQQFFFHSTLFNHKKIMAEWVSRKRKQPNPSSKPSPSPQSAIPSSLLPHLTWTKLPCHKKPRANAGHSGKETLHREVGRAIFFLPHPNTDLDDDEERKMTWFQGRFFPSSSPPSPTSAADAPFRSEAKSWGLMGVQTDVVDECMRCSEGGYRELDLTVIRYTSGGSGSKKVKCNFSAIWTGGDMMALSTDPYAVYGLGEEIGVKFDPSTLIEGRKALEAGSKYFPALSKQIEDGEEALVVVGKMEMIVPLDFVRKGGGTLQRGNDEDDDGLWDD